MWVYFPGRGDDIDAYMSETHEGDFVLRGNQLLGVSFGTTDMPVVAELRDGKWYDPNDSVGQAHDYIRIESLNEG